MSSRLIPSRFIFLPYPHNVWMSALWVWVFAAFAALWLGSHRVHWGALTGAAFAGGIWGQVSFDLNAWSQLIALPWLSWCCWVLLMTPVRIWVWAIHIALGVLIYPEAAIPVLGMAGLLRLLSEPRHWRGILGAAMASLLVSIPVWRFSFGSAWTQVDRMVGQTGRWDGIWFSFLKGPNPEGLPSFWQPIETVLSSIGFYPVLTWWQRSWVQAGAWRIVLCILAGLLLIQVLKLKKDRLSRWFWLGVIVVISLRLGGLKWESSKLWFYLAPQSMVLLILRSLGTKVASDTGTHTPSSMKRETLSGAIRISAISLMLIQFVFLAQRIERAAREGLLHSAPYPGHQFHRLIREGVWDLDSVSEGRVCRQATFFTGHPTVDAFAFAARLGQGTPFTGAVDCEFVRDHEGKLILLSYR